MSATISVVHWEEFQHYRDRDPPWVKLYRDILTSEPWVEGTDASRLAQVAIILLAARYKNAIPYKIRLILRVAALDMSETELERSINFLLSLEFIKIHGVIEKENGAASEVLATCYKQNETLYSEQGNTRELRKEKKLTHIVEFEKLDDVDRVFGHWQRIWKKDRAKLDAKRRAAIKRALKSYDATMLCESISGYRNSPHHTGINERNTVYDDISLFLRDAAHVDAGIEFLKSSGFVSKTRAPTTAELEAREKENANH